MSEFKRSFRISRHRADPARDVSDEIAFYLEMRVRELVADGMTEAEARAEAERRFGDRAAITARVQQLATEQAKRSGLKTLLESAGQDVRFTLRALRREPVFALAAIITLALGIGGNAAVFAITDALLRRRPAIDAPDDVVLVYTTCRRGDPRCGSSYQDYLDYRDRSARLSDLAAVASFPLTVRDEAGADRISGELVTGNYFNVLGIGAALFAQTLRNRLRVDLGFTPRGLTAFSVDPAMNGYDAPRADRVLDELLTQLRTVRGIRAASLATRVPLREGGMGTFIEIEGYSPAPGEELRAEFAYVGANYFSTLGLPVLRGRDFAAAEQSGQVRAVVIDRLTAERWWHGRDPIGGRIRLMEQTYQIVGVVGRVAWNGLDRGTTPLIFMPLAHDPARGAMLTWHVLLRTDGAGVPMGALRDAVRAADPALAPFAFATLEDELATVLAPQRGASAVLACYAALALLIAAVGIYGVVSYSVTRQRHEFGVRLALGATPSELLTSVLRGMSLPVLGGVLLGTVMALAFGRGVNALLFGVRATDVWTYAVAAALLGGVSLAATLGPALSAARTDPTRVLVSE